MTLETNVEIVKIAKKKQLQDNKILALFEYN